MRFAVLVAALVAVSFPAYGQPDQVQVVQNPKWAEVPPNGLMAKYYPDAARKKRIVGTAKVMCLVTTGGHAEHCKALDEDPAGWGFGDAAVKMATYFQFQPRTVNGQPTVGVITVPITFSLRNCFLFC